MTQKEKSIRLKIPADLHSLIKSQAALRQTTLHKLIVAVLDGWRKGKRV